MRLNAVWWTIGLTLAAGIGSAALGQGRDVLLGVGAPVVATAGSWVRITRVWARAPATLLATLIRAVAVKGLFFVAWVWVALAVFEARPAPFVVSFTVSFVTLHLTEAWCLRRLMAAGTGSGCS